MKIGFSNHLKSWYQWLGMQEYITIETVTEEPFEKHLDNDWTQLGELYSTLGAMAVKLPSAYENPEDIENPITKAKIEASRGIDDCELVRYYRVRNEDGIWETKKGRQSGFFYSPQLADGESLLTLPQFMLEDKGQSYIMRTLGDVEMWERGDIKDSEIERFATELQNLFEENINKFKGPDAVSRN